MVEFLIEQGADIKEKGSNHRLRGLILAAGI
jgi:hypothetical protein